MFILTARLQRKKIVLGAAALILLAAVPFALLRTDRGATSIAMDNSERVAYLESFGWDILPEPVETLSVTLPDELKEPYLSYNEMQLEQGFDLSDYCGKTLSRYTYLVTNYPGQADSCQADLYLYEETIVAGDIICMGENGQLCPLSFPELSDNAP